MSLEITPEMSQINQLLLDFGIDSRRDGLYMVDKYLDEFLEYGEPANVYAIEDEFMKGLQELPVISATIARIGMKAIATSQFADQYTRKHNPSDGRDSKVNTYRNLGLLLDKSLRSEKRLSPDRLRTVPNYLEHRGLVGVISELATYSLLGFNDDMTHSLTGRPRAIPTHYTVAATKNEDHGLSFEDPNHRTAFDFKLFTDEVFEDDDRERTILLQVKTSKKAAQDKSEVMPYSKDIIVVALDELLPENTAHNETLLASYIARDALGSRSRESTLGINTAVRNLDKLILERSTYEEDAI